MKDSNLLLFVVLLPFALFGAPNYSGIYTSATPGINLAFCIDDSDKIETVTYKKKAYSITKNNYKFVDLHDGKGLHYFYLGFADLSISLFIISENNKYKIYAGYYFCHTLNFFANSFKYHSLEMAYKPLPKIE